MPDQNRQVDLPQARIKRPGFLIRGKPVKEWIIEGLLLMAGFSSVLITIGIVAILVMETAGFFGMHSRVVVTAPAHMDTARANAEQLGKQRAQVAGELAENARRRAAVEAGAAPDPAEVRKLQAEATQAKARDEALAAEESRANADIARVEAEEKKLEEYIKELDGLKAERKRLKEQLAAGAIPANQSRDAMQSRLGELEGMKLAGFDTESAEIHGNQIWVFSEKKDFADAKAALRGKGFAVDETASRASRVTVWEFLSGSQWTPLFRERRFGILPLIAGTLVTTFVALLVAIPVGTIIAIYLSEYAPHKLRETLKPVLELLSAVPTVVYGYFALLFVTPLLQSFVPNLPGFNMLSAGLVMGVMIIPYVSSLSEDAMHAVPMSMREGSYAMGATNMQTAFKVVMPSALSGVTAAYILGISRALGETMVVAIAAGQDPTLTWSPRDQASTITAYIVQVSKGDIQHASIGYQTIFAAGLTLLLMTLFFNIGGYILRKRYREAY